MELFYPVRDQINQQNLFGANPDWYKTHLNQNGHPGLDFESPSGTKLYAPCDGTAYYVQDKLGGDGIWIHYPSTEDHQYNVILWHLFPKENTADWMIPTDGTGTKIKAGQLLALTDNSGFPYESNGPHLHVGVMPTNSAGAALDPNNGFMGCVDPMPFFNGLYADAIVITENVIAVATNVIASNPLSPLRDAIKSLLIKVAIFLGFPPDK